MPFVRRTCRASQDERQTCVRPGKKQSRLSFLSTCTYSSRLITHDSCSRRRYSSPCIKRLTPDVSTKGNHQTQDRPSALQPSPLRKWARAATVWSKSGSKSSPTTTVQRARAGGRLPAAWRRRFWKWEKKTSDAFEILCCMLLRRASHCMTLHVRGRNGRQGRRSIRLIHNRWQSISIP